MRAQALCLRSIRGPCDGRRAVSSRPAMGALTAALDRVLAPRIAQHHRGLPLLGIDGPRARCTALESGTTSSETTSHMMAAAVKGHLEKWDRPNFAFPVATAVKDNFSQSAEGANLGELYRGMSRQVSAGTWARNPTATEVDMAAMDAAAAALGLPARFTWRHGPGCGIHVHDRAQSLLHVLAAARQRASKSGVVERLRSFQKNTVDSRQWAVYCHPEQAPLVRRACRVAGIDRVVCPSLISRNSSQQFDLDPRSLHAKVQEDAARGYHPLLVVGTFGTDSTLSTDDCVALAAVAREFGCWLHLDANTAASARVIDPQHALQYGFQDAVNVVDSVSCELGRWAAPTFSAASQLWFADRRLALEAFGDLPHPFAGPDGDSSMHASLELRNFHAAAEPPAWEGLPLLDLLARLPQVRAQGSRQLEAANRFNSLLGASAEFQVLVHSRFATVVWRPKALQAGAVVVSDFIRQLNQHHRVSSVKEFLGSPALQTTFASAACDDPVQTARLAFETAQQVWREVAGPLWADNAASEGCAASRGFPWEGPASS
jgi:glutamate/tyrosine decarboxylase-like PLP-dependent enzyme